MKYFLLPLVLLFGCSAKKQVLTWNEDTPFTIKMERTACFGTCPIYEFSFSDKGVMQYDGKRFVYVLGAARTEITATDVQQLRQRLQLINWEQLETTYPCNETDLPSVILTLQTKTYKKRVEVVCNGPEDLYNLITYLDDLHKHYMPNEILAPPVTEEATE
jgi:hypothetical protein